jgi:hypothetical protein
MGDLCARIAKAREQSASLQSEVAMTLAESVELCEESVRLRAASEQQRLTWWRYMRLFVSSAALHGESEQQLQAMRAELDRYR